MMEKALTTVYFVRHAQPNYENHDDMLRELTAKGLEDRKLVTKFLADKNVDVVLSSPFHRSIDTVRHFADSKGLEIGIIDDFRERCIDSVWIEDFNGFCKKQLKRRRFCDKVSTGDKNEQTTSRQPCAAVGNLDLGLYLRCPKCGHGSCRTLYLPGRPLPACRHRPAVGDRSVRPEKDGRKSLCLPLGG